MARPEVDKELIRELARLMEEAGLSEVEWRDEHAHVRVARAAAVPAPVTPAPVATAAPARTEPAVEDEGELGGHPGAVSSPMVGTVYLAPEPGAPPFVKVGDAVSEGQTVLIVEAMKTMNPIPAPRAGTISRILVANDQPVEYGQVLMIIE